jgi:hypothetical protein
MGSTGELAGRNTRWRQITSEKILPETHIVSQPFLAAASSTAPIKH